MAAIWTQVSVTCSVATANKLLVSGNARDFGVRGLGQNIVDDGIVVVGINYRLGVFGMRDDERLIVLFFGCLQASTISPTGPKSVSACKTSWWASSGSTSSPNTSTGMRVESRWLESETERLV